MRGQAARAQKVGLPNFLFERAGGRQVFQSSGILLEARARELFAVAS